MPGVGKESTFRKVDSIIKETRQIVNLIVKVIQMCYSDSKKYNLDFSNVSLEKNAAETTNDTGGDGEFGFGASRRGTVASGAGAANKKTRVSFILSGGY